MMDRECKIGATTSLVVSMMCVIGAVVAMFSGKHELATQALAFSCLAKLYEIRFAQIGWSIDFWNMVKTWCEANKR